MSDDGEERMKERIASMLAAVICINEDHKEQTSGHIHCPLCEGQNTLRWMRAFNGHVSAKCSKVGCLQFIQ